MAFAKDSELKERTVKRYTRRLRKAEGKTRKFKRQLEAVSGLAAQTLKELEDYRSPLDRPSLVERMRSIMAGARG